MKYISEEVENGIRNCNGGGIDLTVRYDPELYTAKLRNGYVKLSGLSFWTTLRHHGPVVYIEGLTSTGRVASGHFTADPDELAKLCEAYLVWYESHGQERRDGNHSGFGNYTEVL